MKNIKLTLIAFCITITSFSQVTNYGIESGTKGKRSAYFGYKAGNAILSQIHDNSFFGHESGSKTTSANHNAFFGSLTGKNNTTGGKNTFLGSLSGQSNTEGGFNVFLGTSSGTTNTTGNYNTFLGTHSGNRNSTGESNVFTGFQSGLSNQTGSENTYIGYRSGYSDQTGSNNVFLGYQSGFKNKTGSNNVFLGNNSGYYELGSNKLYIENSLSKTPLIYGDFETNQVGINVNKIPKGYSFAVKGKAIVEELKVELYNNWPDYVFNKSYKLNTLEEVENYIAKNKHLPNMPSAKEIKNNKGFEIGKMNQKLLEKIEELTLYTIEQNKKLKSQEKRLAKLEALLLNK